MVNCVILILGMIQILDAEQRQALINEHFGNWWKQEYLTELREAHRTTGTNTQLVKIRNIVSVYDDTKRVNWKLAIIKSVNRGANGMIRSANIRTTTRRTNHPIVHLYLLEVRISSWGNSQAIYHEGTRESWYTGTSQETNTRSS